MHQIKVVVRWTEWSIIVTNATFAVSLEARRRRIERDCSARPTFFARIITPGNARTDVTGSAFPQMGVRTETQRPRAPPRARDL